MPTVEHLVEIFYFLKNYHTCSIFVITLFTNSIKPYVISLLTSIFSHHRDFILIK